ncbi:hypothetical protein JTE90_011623 [Oedothorax gibbosus]|uniref:Sugar transporter SWEET1 n=1 Tax=Oedothorax gibbosus TaxID=931172 RepID=A0AAV6U417_9ARAC|nr:hypothetical protein JTE90_011623 [Oedothorax gibbosus]
MDLIWLVGNFALVCTVASNFTGIPICLGFFKNGSTSNISVVPFLAGVTCSSLWLMYGILLGDGTMKAVNSICVLLQISYAISYFINTYSKERAQRLISIVAAFLLAVYAYGFHIADEPTAKITFGYLASLGSIAAFGSPLVSLGEVIRSKSSETLPFTVIFSSFIVGSSWFYYGILVENSFIQVPNLIGAILSAIQLGLIAIYPSKKSKEYSKAD